MNTKTAAEALAEQIWNCTDTEERWLIDATQRIAGHDAAVRAATWLAAREQSKRAISGCILLSNLAVHNDGLAEAFDTIDALTPPADVEKFLAERDAQRKWNVCGVCVGTGKPASERPCICGGTGTLIGEMDGLRKALYESEQVNNERIRLEALEQARLAARGGDGNRFQQLGTSQQYWLGRSDAATAIADLQARLREKGG